MSCKLIAAPFPATDRQTYTLLSQRIQDNDSRNLLKASIAVTTLSVTAFKVMAINVSTVNVPLWLLSPDLTLTSTVTFISLVLAVGLWTHQHGPIRHAAWVIQWNSRLYSIASALMLLLIIQFILRDHKLHDDNIAESPALKRLYSVPQDSRNNASMTVQVPLAPLVYHLSKLYEYTDILLVLSNHGPNYRLFSQQPIDLHFGFHHLTTPYLTLFRMIRSSETGWEVFAALNCAHHVIMYAFFGGGVNCVGLRPEVLRRVLPWTGALQLVAGIAMEVWPLIENRGKINAQGHKKDLEGHWVALGLLSCYLVLYTRDMRMRAKDSTSSAQ